MIVNELFDPIELKKSQVKWVTPRTGMAQNIPYARFVLPSGHPVKVQFNPYYVAAVRNELSTMKLTDAKRADAIKTLANVYSITVELQFRKPYSKNQRVMWISDPKLAARDHEHENLEPEDKKTFQIGDRITGNINTSQLFATVADLAKKFLSQKHVGGLAFIGDGDLKGSRNVIYKALANKVLLTMPNYSLVEPGLLDEYIILPNVRAERLRAIKQMTIKLPLKILGSV